MRDSSEIRLLTREKDSEWRWARFCAVMSCVRAYTLGLGNDCDLNRYWKRVLFPGPRCDSFPVGRHAVYMRAVSFVTGLWVREDDGQADQLAVGKALRADLGFLSSVTPIKTLQRGKTQGQILCKKDEDLHEDVSLALRNNYYSSSYRTILTSSIVLSLSFPDSHRQLELDPFQWAIKSPAYPVAQERRG